MWDNRHGRSTMAKPRIELLKPSTHPVVSKPVRTGPKVRELDKTEIQITWNQNVIEPAQTEPSLPVVFATKKNGAV